MAECLEFGIGISSIVFVEINKCISTLFFKNKLHSILSISKTKAGCYKKKNHTHNKQTKAFNNLPNSCCK